MYRAYTAQVCLMFYRNRIEGTHFEQNTLMCFVQTTELEVLRFQNNVYSANSYSIIKEHIVISF